MTEERQVETAVEAARWAVERIRIIKLYRHGHFSLEELLLTVIGEVKEHMSGIEEFGIAKKEVLLLLGLAIAEERKMMRNISEFESILEAITDW